MTASDVVAEAQVLGMALTAPGATRGRFLALGSDAWTTYSHEQIAAAITDLYRRDAAIDVPSVQRAVTKRVGTDDAARRASMYVYELTETAAPLTSLSYYAERVDKMTRANRAITAANLFSQRVEAAIEIDDEDAYGRAVADMTTAVDDAAAPFGQTAEPPMGLADLLEVDTGHDWLIPHLFERTDRLILTGWEGLGKSELACQLALTAAAGLHPFSGHPLGGAPIRVLVVDAENAQRQIARRYRRVRGMVDDLLDRAGMRAPDWNQAVRFVIRPEGIPLSNPRELARLEQAIAVSAPDLIVAGPIYKLADQDTRDEQAAKALAVTLDRLRARHQFALVLEAHSGHGSNQGPRSVRPTGSSLFLRWPEFGYGIKPAPGCEEEDHPKSVQVVSWRGPREERAWPKWFTRSTRLPWDPADATYSDGLDEPGLRAV